MRDTANDDDDGLWRGLDWNDVRIFLAVAETGSLNAAARNLHLTQPTISRRMEDLEYRLNAKLFSRSSRGVVLTDAGASVRDLATSMARFGGAIVRELAQRDKSEAGRVRIAAPDGLASVILVPKLAAFQRANPEIEIALDCGLWLDAPIEGETHLSLEFSDHPAPGLASTPLATMHYVYFASREYLTLYGEPKSAAEVAQHRMVRHVSHREQTNTWNPKLQAVNELAGTHLISNSSASTLMAIKHGAGIGVLPTCIVRYEPDLVMLDLEPMAHPLLHLRYDPAAVRQSRVQKVRDWLIEVFDPAQQPWFRGEFVHPRDFERLAGVAPVAASQT
ncbi:MAG: LysR family transcriptional regulator [Caulobacteraceae bacterium]|nr:LysR family transcriptional regulator [Caulobacteraceae bacterium]